MTNIKGGLILHVQYGKHCCALYFGSRTGTLVNKTNGTEDVGRLTPLTFNGVFWIF